MNLYKRGSIYYFDFVVDGERRRGSTGETIKANAKRFAMKEFQRVRDQLVYGDKPQISVNDAFLLSISEVSGDTAKSYDLARRKWLGIGFPGRWHLPVGCKMDDLSNGDLEAHVRNRRFEGLRENSILVEIRAMQRVYNRVHMDFLVSNNLTFRKPKAFVRKRVFSLEEEEQIISILLDNHSRGRLTGRKAYNLFVMLVDTGMRLGEALNLRWQDIDLSRDRLEFYRSKTDQMAVVPMSERLRHNLIQRRTEPAPFTSMDYALKKLRRVIDDVCNSDARTNAQRGKTTIHSARDTFVTRMEARGLSKAQIGLLIGHSSIETTKKYSHLVPGDILDVARKAIAS